MFRSTEPKTISNKFQYSPSLKNQGFFKGPRYRFQTPNYIHPGLKINLHIPVLHNKCSRKHQMSHKSFLKKAEQKIAPSEHETLP